MPATELPLPDPPPPGSRVRIRGEEWAVQKCLPLPDGGHAVHVQGITELVRYHQAIFLTPLDRDMVPLRPEDTTLVTDPSPGYAQTRLYLETLLRRTPPTHSKVAIGHTGALTVMPYQLVPAQHALEALRPRLLIADGTGLGKTVELGLILSELIKRGRGRRILVVAIRSMLSQLQRELWARFTLPLVRLDSEGIKRVQDKIPSNRNPFSYFDRVIVSIDTLKNHGMYRAWLEQIRWDAIVVDECHNVANRGSQRSSLARLLASQCDALVLTSATPHNGKAESFANLMQMLDPTSIADPHSFTKEDVQHLFVRRFKRDVEQEAQGQLQDRKVVTLDVAANPAEETALAAVHALPSTSLGVKARKDELFRWTVVKAYLSSPTACLETLDHRIASVDRALDKEHPRAAELAAHKSDLAAVRTKVQRAADEFGKLDRLVTELRAIGVSSKKDSRRVVIFSERIATLTLLKQTLLEALKLKADAIGVYTAREGDEAGQRELVESFGHADSPLRILLCSDAASEGVNLHYQCHHLFHFDVPWSLIRLTQRNGRVDRFGQQHQPVLHYMVTRTTESTADQRIVSRLIEKEREVERQLGDPGALLGLYEAEREDDFLTRGVATGKAPEALIPDAPVAASTADAALAQMAEEPSLEPEPEPEIDILALLADVQKEQAGTPRADDLIAKSTTLFENDYTMLTAALRHLEKHPVVGPEPLQWKANDAGQYLEVKAPEPFRRHREVFLPREAVPSKGAPYKLVAGKADVADKLREALDSEGRWPEWHLLWEQHPLVEWLLDSLGSAYARGEAPILRVPHVGAGQAIFLLHGMMFNHESEAVYSRWHGIEAKSGTLQPTPLTLDDVVRRVRLDGPLSNAGVESPRKETLQALVKQVVEAAKLHTKEERQHEVKTDLVKRARQESRRVEKWAQASLQNLETQRARYTAKVPVLPRHIEQRLARAKQDVLAVQKNHTQLLHSISTKDEPYVRLVAVFAGD